MVVDTVYTIQYACTCGRASCKSFYPCLLVYVMLNNTDTKTIPDTAQKWPFVAYDDDWQQIRVQRLDDNNAERVSWNFHSKDIRRHVISTIEQICLL